MQPDGCSRCRGLAPAAGPVRIECRRQHNGLFSHGLPENTWGAVGHGFLPAFKDAGSAGELSQKPGSAM